MENLPLWGQAGVAALGYAGIPYGAPAVLGVGVGAAGALGTPLIIGYALYKKFRKAGVPPPKPAEKSLIEKVAKEGNKAAAKAAAAFLDAGSKAATVLKAYGFSDAARLVGANPTTASIAAILVTAGVSYAAIRKFKSMVSRKGGKGAITRRATKKAKNISKTLTKLSKPTSRRTRRTKKKYSRRR
jgi:uncharacterized protein (UPF0333 family)